MPSCLPLRAPPPLLPALDAEEARLGHTHPAARGGFCAPPPRRRRLLLLRGHFGGPAGKGWSRVSAPLRSAPPPDWLAGLPVLLGGRKGGSVLPPFFGGRAWKQTGGGLRKAPSRAMPSGGPGAREPPPPLTFCLETAQVLLWGRGTCDAAETPPPSPFCFLPMTSVKRAARYGQTPHLTRFPLLPFSSPGIPRREKRGFCSSAQLPKAKGTPEPKAEEPRSFPTGKSCSLFLCLSRSSALHVTLIKSKPLAPPADLGARTAPCKPEAQMGPC